MQTKEKSLTESLRHIETADHMTYVTFPLVNEKKLLLKIFEEIHKAMISLTLALIVHESKKRKMKIYCDDNKNFKKFIEILGNHHLKKDEIRKITEIEGLYKKHKASAMEFSRKDSVIIMQDNLDVLALDIKKIKEYLALCKSLFIKISLILNN
jgi:hypothetical protein